MKKIKAEDGWAIHGKFGFYYGWAATRAQAIAGHVSQQYGYSEWPIDGKLSKDQAKAWRECQTKGDSFFGLTLTKGRTASGTAARKSCAG